VGEFIFHDQHNHWHLAGFALYEVWSVTEDGRWEALVASGGKVSYCVLDIYRSGDAPEGAAYPRWASYTSCQGDLQGLTPGWVDVYDFDLPGQYVEVTDLPDGIYALVSRVNPDQHVLEQSARNNVGVAYFSLQDTRLEVLEKPES
jgi:hypothetical protein